MQNNSGGILVSDELGPTHDNVITGNTVVDNTLNCGITIVGHKKGAVDASGKLHPKVAGVYDNTFTKNVVTNNGTTGTGAGILLANPKAGMATYRNTISGNTDQSERASRRHRQREHHRSVHRRQRHHRQHRRHEQPADVRDRRSGRHDRHLGVRRRRRA